MGSERKVMNSKIGDVFDCTAVDVSNTVLRAVSSVNSCFLSSQ
jgi:hypothetical protein